MKDLNRDLALRLAEHGIATFPCRPETKGELKSKVPLVKWKDESTTDPHVIARWWMRYPNALPGIDLRKCGLIVLDGDRHNPEIDGVAALRDLLRMHRVQMRDVPVTATPGNGVHAYFRNDAGLGDSTGSLPPGIDVRGKGLTISPCTVLPDQRRYRAVGPCLLGAVKAGAVPPLPSAIAEIIQRPKHAPAVSSSSAPRVCAGERTEIYAQAALDGCVADLSVMGDGSGRNIALNGAAYRMGRMVASGWIDRAEVERALINAATANGYVAKDGIRAAQVTVKSGMEAGLKRPHPGLLDRAA